MKSSLTLVVVALFALSACNSKKDQPAPVKSADPVVVAPVNPVNPVVVNPPVNPANPVNPPVVVAPPVNPENPVNPPVVVAPPINPENPNANLDKEKEENAKKEEEKLVKAKKELEENLKMYDEIFLSSYDLEFNLGMCGLGPIFEMKRNLENDEITNLLIDLNDYIALQEEYSTLKLNDEEKFICLAKMAAAKDLLDFLSNL